MALLEVTDVAPAKTIEVEDAEKKKILVENPAYVGWLARDQQVLRFLLNKLSPDILSHLLDVSFTAEAWSAINAMFKTTSRTKAQHLREKLNETKKLSMTADTYYTKMKGFASELSALGKPVEDDEMLGYLLHGLDKGEYNALITSVNANPGTTLDDFYEQLSSYDMRNGVEENGEFVSFANLARHGREQQQRSRGRTPPPRGRTPDPAPYRGGGGGGYRDRDDDHGYWRRDDRRDRRRDDGGGDRRQFDGGGRRFDRTPTPYVDTDCQICTKHGHPASKCWWRYSDDKKNKDDREGAHLASYGVDTNCSLHWRRKTCAPYFASPSAATRRRRFRMTRRRKRSKHPARQLLDLRPRAKAPARPSGEASVKKPKIIKPSARLKESGAGTFENAFHSWQTLAPHHPRRPTTDCHSDHQPEPITKYMKKSRLLVLQLQLRRLHTFPPPSPPRGTISPSVANTPPEIIPVSSEKLGGEDPKAKGLPKKKQVQGQGEAEAYATKFFNKLTEAEKWELEQDLLNAMLNNAWGNRMPRRRKSRNLRRTSLRQACLQTKGTPSSPKQEQQALHYELHKNIALQRRVTLGQAENIRTLKNENAELNKQLVDAQGASSSLATTSSELENLRSSYQELETKLKEAEQKKEQAEKQLAEKNSELIREKGEFLLKRNADSETIKRQQEELNGLSGNTWRPRSIIGICWPQTSWDLISASRKICHNLSLKKSRTCGLRKLIKRMDILPELVTDLQASSARRGCHDFDYVLAHNPEMDLDRVTIVFLRQQMSRDAKPDLRNPEPVTWTSSKDAPQEEPKSSAATSEEEEEREDVSSPAEDAKGKDPEGNASPSKAE
ncbi:hypothetical protein QYE76_062579 [Lolium multiflorum]|uniref:Uncharacterized protein n=1 Tax=Lolium multiflorum TaxID=4521 RepID=A0AAD8S3B1_LOLMU|nr:hypothetical protein QYE76_062579 [Lolium multiflorum]